VEVQIEVAKNKGGVGFLFWNANNDYSKPFTAMPEMRTAKGKFFRGDEIKTEAATPATPVVSTPTPTPQPVSSPVKIWRH
jgi:hypothetical protein